VYRDLAAGGVDVCFHRALECRAFLEDMVAQESECAVLQEHSRFLIDRAVRKSEPHAASNAVASCHLCGLAVGDGLALLRPQH
jgi:hypothetical protein